MGWDKSGTTHTLIIYTVMHEGLILVGIACCEVYHGLLMFEEKAVNLHLISIASKLTMICCLGNK